MNPPQDLSATPTTLGGNHSVTYSNGGGSAGARYNPFRYRGYYYDTDLDMYYLQSRYYDPNTCRFINADGYVSTSQGLTGYNMFAYCNNNVMPMILLPLLGIEMEGDSLEYVEPYNTQQPVFK